ncbi:MAG: hypothetical protein LC792_02355 [Actinobacteria bacterium]|nr:hypothetical protein [Actinomycetota bacterium]
MEILEGYSVVRTFEAGRPPWGRWEVRDATGLIVGVIAEEPAGRHASASTFTAVHNPSPTPFVLRFPRHLRARGAWWSGGHDSVSVAVAALAVHLCRTGVRSGRHYMTGVRA